MQVSLIGWSLGGIMSRKLAVKRPDLIRRVIMLGSPVHGTATSTRVGALMAMIEKTQKTTVIKRKGTPIRPAQCKVPIVSLFNRFDAIANWKNCFETESELAENIHVTASLWFRSEPSRHAGDYRSTRGATKRVSPLPRAGICARLHPVNGHQPIKKAGSKARLLL